MKWRESPDGTLVAPARGEPPECPEGYESVEPFKCVPKLPECPHRGRQTRRTSCCVHDEIICKVISTVVTRRICKTCGGSVEWITGLQRNVG